MATTADASLITVNDANAFGLLNDAFGHDQATYGFGAGSAFLPSLSGGSGDSAWTAKAPGGLQLADGLLRSATADVGLSFSFSSGNVYAVGGHFFLTDVSFNQVVGLAYIELADGTAYLANISNAQTFSGFVSTGAAISQITISPFGTQPGVFATAGSLSVGVVPAPAALALLACGGLAGSRRRRG